MGDITEKDLRCIRWTLLNPDTGILNATVLCWKDAEAAKCEYDFTLVDESITAAQRIGRVAILRVSPEAPLWWKNEMCDFIDFIRALGAVYDCNQVMFSIDITMPGSEHCMNEEDIVAVAEAYMEAFPRTYKLADINCGRIASYLKGREGVGLVLDAREDSLKIGEQLARLSLQRVWEKAPIRMMAGDMDEALMNNAIRWHVSNIDSTGTYDDESLAHIGYRIEMRRVSFAASAKHCDKVPLSAWFINNGNAPCYNDSSFYLRLARADIEDEQIIKTSFTVKRFYPGEDMLFTDDIFIAQLPQGEYDVHLGLFSSDTGYPVVLGIEGRISDGFYSTLMSLTIDAKLDTR